MIDSQDGDPRTTDERGDCLFWYPEHGLQVYANVGEVRINLPIEVSLHPVIALQFALKIMEAAGTAEGKRAAGL